MWGPMMGDVATTNGDDMQSASTGPPTRRGLPPVAVAVVTVAVAGSGLAGWFAGAGPDRQGVTGVSGPPGCPAAVPGLPPRRDGLDLRLVPVLPLPVGPVTATVCRYPGGSVVVGVELDAARTAEVAGWFDTGGVPVPADRVLRCPGDDVPVVVVTFRYASGPPVQVTVQRSGCRTVSNGVRVEATRDDVLTRLDRLTG